MYVVSVTSELKGLICPLIANNLQKREYFTSLAAVRVVFLALTQHCNLPELLGREVMKEGEKLADILSMPVKDALGRDVEVNYESDIANVLELLDATMARKSIFSDSVELHKLTLAQVAHVRAYERDAAQAVQWLDDLFQVSRYPSLCCLQGCEQALVAWGRTRQRSALKNTVPWSAKNPPSPSSATCPSPKPSCHRQLLKIFICVYITNYLHFFTMFLSF